MQQDNWKRLGLLMVLVVGMGSLGAAGVNQQFTFDSSLENWIDDSEGTASVYHDTGDAEIDGGSAFLDGNPDYNSVLKKDEDLSDDETVKFYFKIENIEASQARVIYRVTDESETGHLVNEFEDYSSTTGWIEREMDVSDIDGAYTVKFFSVGGFSDLGGDVRIDNVRYTANSPPEFNSTSLNPDAPIIGQNVSYSAEVYDSDGSIDHTNLTLEYGGSTVVSDAQRTGNNPSWNDVFVPQTGNKWLNATFTTVDDAGATTTTQINRYLSDEAPNISINKPGNKTYWSYDTPVNISVEDSDSKPGETFGCTASIQEGLAFTGGSGYSYTKDFTIEEGVNKTFTDTGLTRLSRDTPKTEFQVSCSDPAQNSETKQVNYSVKAEEFQNQDIPITVYESKKPANSLKVKLGEMVENIKASYFFNGSEDNSASKDVNGANNYTLNAANSGVPLVQNNDTAFDGYWKYTVNITDFNSNNYSQFGVKTSNVSQSVYHAIHSPSVSTDKNRYIEKEDPQITYSYTNESFEGSIYCSLSLKGSTKTGDCSQSIDSGLVSGTNKESVSASGDATISFDGDTRTLGNQSTSFDVYRKILTDCSNSVYGVTGVKALAFTLYDEENRSNNLNGNIAYNFDVTKTGEHSRNYAFDKNSVKSADMCLYPSWAEYSVTGPVQYSSDSTQNSNNLVYPDRQYNLNNQSIDSNTENLDLYLLDETFSTPVYFEVTDQGGDGIPGVTVTVQRYFIGQDSYITVAKSETDSDGVATTYMRVNEIYYKYTVKDKDGNVLLNTDREILTCQESPCTKELRVDPLQDDPYFTEKQAFQYDTQKIFNNQGNLTGFQATVSHEEDVFKQSSLKVRREKPLGTDLICNITSVSNPTTHVCQFNSPAGDDRISYTLTAETENNKYTLDKGVINEPGNLFGDNAYFAAFIIFAMLASIGLASPKAGIVFSTAGVIVPWYIGFYELSVAAVGSLVIVALVLVAGGRS